MNLLDRRFPFVTLNAHLPENLVHVILGEYLLFGGHMMLSPKTGGLFFHHFC